MTNPSNPNPSPELHGLDPGELLARGINTVRPSGGMQNWTPPSAEELARLLPQYEIECLIGQGGMGAVYKGFQKKLGRTIAIKVLPVELTANPEFAARFEREARTLAKLQHPGIVSIYDYGQTSDEHPYFVMEYVEGTDLRRLMQGPGLNPEQALEIIVQVCEALNAAHRQGVVHRDIKPANILITKDGRMKLADFGLARPDREEHESITVSNMVMGTPDYMAPEQHGGHSDHRTDIFALGLMLYEMLTGQLPRGAFVAPSRKVQVDVRIDEVVLKALQEEPNLRYQQASEMKTDVDTIRSGPEVPQPPQASRSVAWTAAVVGLVLAVLLGGTTFWFAKSRPAPASGSMAALPGLNLGSGVKKISPAGPGALLQEIEYMPSDSGLKKFVYAPTKPGYGLIIRCTGRPEVVLDNVDVKMGYNENTVFERIQAPGEGWDNTAVLVKGSAVGANPEGPANSFSIWLSQAMDDDEEDDKTFLMVEHIPYLNMDRELHDDRVNLVFTNPYKYDPKNPELDPPWLKLEIKAVPFDELKARYPELQNPETPRVDYVDGKNYDQEVSKYYMAKSGCSLAYKAALEGDVAKAKAEAERAIGIEPDNPWNRINYGWCLFNLGLYSEALTMWREVEQRDPAAYYNMNVAQALAMDKMGSEKEALRLYAEQVKKNRGFGQWDSLQYVTSDWSPKEKEAVQELFKKWSATQPQEKSAAGPQLASDGPKLKKAEFPKNEYGLSKITYTPAGKDLGLVVRYTASPACMNKLYPGEEEYREETVYEWAWKPVEGGQDIQIMYGNPMWHQADADEIADNIYTLRISHGPDEQLFDAQKFPFLQPGIEAPLKDAKGRITGYELAFKRYKNGLMSTGDPGETWLKVEVTAMTLDDLKIEYPELKEPNRLGIFTIDGKLIGEGGSSKPASSAVETASKTDLSDFLPQPKRREFAAGPFQVIEVEASETATAKTIISTTKANQAIIVRWTMKPELMPEWDREKFSEKTVFEWVQVPKENGKNFVVLSNGSPIWDEDHADENGDGAYAIDFFSNAGSGAGFFTQRRMPLLDLEKETSDNSLILKFERYEAGKMFAGYPHQTWLKFEVTAMDWTELKERYPKMRRPGEKLGISSARYIDGKDSDEEVAKPTSSP